MTSKWCCSFRNARGWCRSVAATMFSYQIWSLRWLFITFLGLQYTQKYSKLAQFCFLCCFKVWNVLFKAVIHPHNLFRAEVMPRTQKTAVWWWFLPRIHVFGAVIVPRMLFGLLSWHRAYILQTRGRKPYSSWSCWRMLRGQLRPTKASSIEL